MPDHRWTLRLDGSSLPDKSIIGGKAWSIARMRGLGLLVPPAFVITTDACRAFLGNGELPADLLDEVAAGIRWLESQTSRGFGATHKPLLVSVRSGSAISMPGMMDTILNLGMSDAAEVALAAEFGLRDFSRNTHLRFLELYSSIVLKSPLDRSAEDTSPAALREHIGAAAGQPVPIDPREQLHQSIRAVFESWNSRRARRYREHNNIPHDLGTAVTVQAMVFGNLDERSGTGVLFSRNPLTGERLPYGEYLPRAQGEDVVSGRFTPLPLDSMRVLEPRAHAGLLSAAAVLEREHGDVQDIEFTVQSGELFLLQSRAAKRAPMAAVRTAVEMVAEGMIDVDAALSRVTPEQVQAILRPRLRDGVAEAASVIARGEGACPGISSGIVVGDPDEAESRAAAGEDVILMRQTTSPEDIHGMIAARAVITEHGGSTSHAAVVSRALGRPCVVGVGDGSGVRLGEMATVDGANGTVYSGVLAVDAPRELDDSHLAQLVVWARGHTDVAVLTPGEAAGTTPYVDIDERVAANNVGGVESAVAGLESAGGAALSNPANALLAVSRGVKTIVTEPVLPVLLSLLRRVS